MPPWCYSSGNLLPRRGPGSLVVVRTNLDYRNSSKIDAAKKIYMSAVHLVVPEQLSEPSLCQDRLLMQIKSCVDAISGEGVVGWAVDCDNPKVPVEILVMVNGAEHGRCIADIERSGLRDALGQGFSGRHEFRYSFIPSLHLDYDMLVQVMTASRQPVDDGSRILRGATRRHRSLMPIMLSSRGRSGTTMLMSEFARHPEIVVADTYPYEIKHASYYAAAHQVLTFPRFGNDLDFAENAESRWKIGGNPWNRHDLNSVTGGEPLTRLFEDSIPRRLGDQFRQFALDAYGIMALERGKPDARFFAEKTSLTENVRYGLRAMFGDVREIVLLRDPRDYLCSARAFWHQTTTTVLDLLAVTLPALERIRESAGPDTMFVRYEDLMLQPTETRQRIYQFIGVADITAEMPATESFPGHVTSANPDASVGRWKQDLAAEDAAACLKLFGSYMERFGYTP